MAAFSFNYYVWIPSLGPQEKGLTQKSEEWQQVSGKPLHVYLHWRVEGGNDMMVAEIRDTITNLDSCYAKRYAFPLGSDRRSLSRTVADEIEGSLCRPVEWRIVEESGNADQGKPRSKPKTAIIALVAVAIGVCGLFANASITASRERATSTQVQQEKTIEEETEVVDTVPRSTTVETSVSSGSQTSRFINSSEFDTLKTNIKVAGSGLNEVVASGDTSQLQIRRSLVWSALREFESLSVPSECRTMRDYYVYASEDLVHALDYYTDYFEGRGSAGTLDNAVACIEEATDYLNTAIAEENKLK